LGSIASGLDLSGNPGRCSGYSEIDVDMRAIVRVGCLYRDEEILSVIVGRVSIVAIDAPITHEPRVRELDRIVIRMGFRVLPPSLGGMRILTQRAWRLYGGLSSMGVRVIETHPRSALKNSGFEDPVDLIRWLGIKPPPEIPKGRFARDIMDAIVASLVAYCYLEGGCVEEIRASDGVLYLISRRSPNDPI
jgi:predicted nuclease with RNAse H fold